MNKSTDPRARPSAAPPKAEAGTWTIGRLLDWTAKFLAEKGVEFPRLDTELLLAHALQCERIQLYTRYEEVAAEAIRDAFRGLVRKRLEGCPVAYLIGRKEFFSLRFEVTPAVLIPRPDTECLVVECLRLAKGIPQPRVLDVGTGSGAIAVAVAKQHSGASVTATDVSAEALTIAAGNAARHGVDARIRFVSGDLFEPLSGEELFDFILSNPPYIAREDLPKLPVGVRDFEPHLALDGGPGGFEVFERLVRAAPAYLKSGGYLLVEIGSPQEKRAREIIASDSNFELAPTIFDHSGHPRVLLARKKGA